MAANRTAIMISREHMELWMKAIEDRIKGAHERQAWEIQALMDERVMIKERNEHQE